MRTAQLCKTSNWPKFRTHAQYAACRQANLLPNTLETRQADSRSPSSPLKLLLEHVSGKLCSKALAKRRWRTTRKMLKNPNCIAWLACKSTRTCPNLATCDSSIPMALCSIDKSTCKGPSLATLENPLVFPQTIYALNATLDLAALVLVGMPTFLGSEVVLAPFGSLHVGGGFWLVWPLSWALMLSWLPSAPSIISNLNLLKLLEFYAGEIPKIGATFVSLVLLGKYARSHKNHKFQHKLVQNLRCIRSIPATASTSGQHGNVKFWQNGINLYQILLVSNKKPDSTQTCPKSPLLEMASFGNMGLNLYQILPVSDKKPNSTPKSQKSPLHPLDPSEGLIMWGGQHGNVEFRQHGLQLHQILLVSNKKRTQQTTVASAPSLRRPRHEAVKMEMSNFWQRCKIGLQPEPTSLQQTIGPHHKMHQNHFCIRSIPATPSTWGG